MKKILYIKLAGESADERKIFFLSLNNIHDSNHYENNPNNGKYITNNKQKTYLMSGDSDNYGRNEEFINEFYQSIIVVCNTNI